MVVFLVLIAAMGWVAGMWYHNLYFTYFALLFGGVYALIQYFAAAKIALAVNGAHEIRKQDNPRLWRTVENLCIATGMPMPKVYVIDDPAPNAFATGRDPQHAIVVATTGLLELMDDSELEGVIAHELGHVKNYDIRVMMIVFGLVAAIAVLADILRNMFWFGGNRDREDNGNPLFLVIGIVVAILAPIIAFLVQMAVSRRREYLADSTSALTTRYPEGLIHALEKLRDHGRPMQRQNTATAHLFFANPLKGGAAKLFSTHPPIEDRIARLRKMGNSA
jgi:heat shock protein HtpX